MKMLNPDWTIREIKSQAEWDEVLTLLTSVFIEEGFSSQASRDSFFVQSTLEEQGVFLIALDPSNKIVGVILLLHKQSQLCQVARADEAEFRLLAVDPEARGSGLGKALIEVCIDKAKQEGAQAIVLCTQPTMHAAQKLYENLGFVRQPERDFDMRRVYSLML